MRELNWVYYYSNVEKGQNQYTHEECTRVGPVDAKYVKSSNRDFNNNPFIEALPRPRDGNVLLNAYTVPIPSLDADDLSKMSVNEQKATVVSLKNLRLPLSFQKQLEFINYDVIVSSYMLRKSYVWDTNAIGESTDKKLIKMKGKIEDSAPSRFALLGYSGCGKSSSLKKNKYQMPESNISNMVYESKMMTKVIDLVREIYVEFDSDSIGRATRMVLEEDVNHRLKPHEVAKQVIAILNEEPVKPKRKATRRTPASKNICDYITDDN